VSADIEEGYSRGTGKDRARFYEYGLGSAREARGWYFKGRHVLGEPVIAYRIDLLTHVIRLLLTMVPDQRGQVLREELIPITPSPSPLNLLASSNTFQLGSRNLTFHVLRFTHT
jgi:hypothetical protein